MKKCPNCNSENGDNSKFCMNCGFTFPKKKNKLLKILLIIASLLVFLYAAMLICNYFFELENLKPFESKFKMEDAKCILKADYNKENHEIDVQLITDEIIEAWQIDTVKKKETVNILTIKNKEQEKQFKSNDLNLKKGKNLELDFKLQNQNLKDYIELKKMFSGENEITLDVHKNLALNNTTRKYWKNKHYAQIKMQKIKKQQEEATRQRRLQMQQIYNPYLWY